MTTRISATACLATSFGLLLAQGCAVSGSQSESGSINHAVADPAPVATDVDVNTQWKYLLDRYDANHDGEVSAAEYSREGQSIDRWDHNGDGLLSDADFESSVPSGGMRGGRAEMMRQMRDPIARRMMSRYFQRDGNNEIVTRSEFDGVLASYDANQDGSLEPSEFRAQSASFKVTAPGDDSPMVKRFMGDMDPWDTIAAAVDRDEDGNMSSIELASFYDKMASGTGEWNLESVTDGGQRSRAGASEKSGPMVGTMAPDFTLETPDSDDTVRLSSFRGSKPVALIFGSYT